VNYNPDVHHRHSIRLREYDYSTAGAYFVTVCTQEKERLFGEVIDGEMRLNDAGRMVERIWRELSERFPLVILDEFVIMPNHFHGIIFLSDRRGEPCVRPNEYIIRRGKPCVRPIQQGDHKNVDHKEGDHRGTRENSLGRIMQALKSVTTVEYVRGVHHINWPPFPGRLWQRDYFERIIRNEKELNVIREYIINNPARWADDPENQKQGK
jgi:putative transposase